MKILHYIQNFPPEYRGGTESYVLNLTLRQARTGHLVHVVSGSDREDAGKDHQKELAGRVRVTRLFRLPEDGPRGLLPRNPRISEKARAILRAFDPDIVHVHHWHNLSDDLVRMAAGERFPVVLTLHDFFPVCPRFFRIKQGESAICPSTTSPAECFTCIRDEHGFWPADLVKLLYDRRMGMFEEVSSADFIYTFSHAVADFFKAIPWFPHASIEVFPIGILRPLICTLPRPDPVPLKIATWGGQTAVKGTHLLLEAVSRPELKDKVEVHVLGRIFDTSYRERLLQLGKGCRVVLHGFFPESEKERLGERFDLAVFPTQAFETYSIVVDEALSMGLPVITTKPGAQCERVGDGGRSIPANDVEALARSLQAFLDHDTRIKAASAAARVRVGTVDTHWMRLGRIYSSLSFHSPRRGRERNRPCLLPCSFGAARPFRPPEPMPASPFPGPRSIPQA